MIHSVVEDSLAARLGLRPNDVLVEIDGRRIKRVSDIRDALAAHSGGAEIDAVVYRAGERRALQGQVRGSR